MIDTPNHSTKYVIIIPMTRVFTNQLLTMFIPTFILWLFGYATLFIVPDEDGFANRFMGAGTALLVIATFLNAINSELPKTSYLKYIDLWFLWHVISIFAMIVYHIILDRMRRNYDTEKLITESFHLKQLMILYHWTKMGGRKSITSMIFISLYFPPSMVFSMHSILFLHLQFNSVVYFKLLIV